MHARDASVSCFPSLFPFPLCSRPSFLPQSLFIVQLLSQAHFLLYTFTSHSRRLSSSPTSKHLIKMDSSAAPKSGPITWTTTTIVAVAFSSSILLIVILIFLFFMVRRKSFTLPKRYERNSVAQLSWSPVTTLNSTPLPSTHTSPIGPLTSPATWSQEKLGSGNESVRTRNSRVPSSFYSHTATLAAPDTAPNSPTPMRSKSTLSVMLGARAHIRDEEQDETYDADISSRAVDIHGIVLGHREHAAEDDEDDAENRSISPLCMSPILSRLPSVRSGPTRRVSDLVRARASASEPWPVCDSRQGTVLSCMSSNSSHRDFAARCPTALEAHLSVVEGRSALFSQDEKPSRF